VDARPTATTRAGAGVLGLTPPREGTLVLSLILIAIGVVAVLTGIAVVSPALAVAIGGLMAVGVGVALFPVRDRQ
jgi:hypothetical protein